MQDAEGNSKPIRCKEFSMTDSGLTVVGSASHAGGDGEECTCSMIAAAHPTHVVLLVAASDLLQRAYDSAVGCTSAI